MIIKIRSWIYGILLFILFFPANWAFAKSQSPLPAGYLCNQLANKKTYENTDLDDFRLLISGSEGWMYRSRLDLKYRFKLSSAVLDYFSRLNAAFHYQGTDLVIAMMPTRGMTSAAYLLQPWASQYHQQSAIKNYQDMLETLRGVGLRVAHFDHPEKTSDFFYSSDNHWTAQGARAMAVAVAAEVKALPSYSHLPRKIYKTATRPGSAEIIPNEYQETAQRICGQPLTESAVPYIFETQSGEAVDENALFGDNTPDIVLLGTSNSTQPGPSYANFEGFLKEDIGADIMNEAVSGGSLQGSISHYLINGHYHDAKPKIAVWEMAAYYGYNQQSFFREIIPAVYGMCDADQSLVHTTQTLKNTGETVLFEKMDALHLQGHAYYLALKAADQKIRNVKVHFLYQDGYKETVDLKRPERSFPETNGIFYAEISDLATSPVSTISVEVGNGRNSVEARICKVPAIEVPEMQKQSANMVSPIKKNQTAPVENFLEGLFQKTPDKIHIAKIDHIPSLVLPHFPDMSSYTVAGVLNKLPPVMRGKISIGPMEGAPPLRKFAFDKRLVEMRVLQGRIDPLAIHIYSGHYDFKTLVKIFKEKGVIEDTPGGYILRLPIALYPGAVLSIRDLDKPLLLSQDKGSFIAAAGQLFIIHSTIIGWNEALGRPAQLVKGMDHFRPFIAMWDGSALYIAGSHIKNLGYALSKSYGITLSTNNVVQEELGEQAGALSPPTGWLIENDFQNMYFGFYSYEARNVVLYKNHYQDNIIYGIDPHDRSHDLIIASNVVAGTKIKHGIILSRDVNDSFIFDNIVESNNGSGIMLDRNARHNFIARNIVRYNAGDGLTLYESPDNIFYNNVIENNGGHGMRIRNSWNIQVAGGRIALNKKQALNAYQDDLKDTSRDFTVDPVVARTSVVFRHIEVESNGGLLTTKGFENLTFQDMRWSAASLLKKRYYGDLQDYEEKLGDLEHKNYNFLLYVNAKTAVP